MINIYQNSVEEISGVKAGTCSITNEVQTLEGALTELGKLESGIWYLSANTLNGSNSSKSFVRLVAYLKQNFREKFEMVGAGNTIVHFMLTLV